MSVRHLTVADRAALIELDAATNSHPWHYTQWQDSLHSHLCLGLEEQGQIVASCVAMLTLDEAELLQIAVDPARFGQGLGQQLLGALCAALQERGAKQLFLEVRAGNERAKRFYLAAGFAPVGVRKGYYPTSSGREDALLYRLDLSGAAA